MNHCSLVMLCALACAPGLDLLADTADTEIGVDDSAPAPLTTEQLDKLLSPIALYPDPLLAIILPASTFPADVVLAARHLQSGADPASIENQPWDDSVKALARYPEVLKWMDENLAWTRQVGAAFAQQPAAVLTSTQRLRAAARAAGNLQDTPQQTVIVERETIRVVPAQTEIIYVPVYDPVWVYRPRLTGYYYSGPLIRFSCAYRTGYWLSYHCNWDYDTVVVIDRPHRVLVWQNNPRWSCPAPSTPYVHHVWRASPDRLKASASPGLRSRGPIALPSPNTRLLSPSAAVTPSVASLTAKPSASQPSSAVSDLNYGSTQTPAGTDGISFASRSPRDASSNLINRTTNSVASSPARGDRAPSPGSRRQQNIPATPAPTLATPSNTLSADTPAKAPAAPGTSPRIRQSATLSSDGSNTGFGSTPLSQPAANRPAYSRPGATFPSTPSRQERAGPPAIQPYATQPAPAPLSVNAAQPTPRLRNPRVVTSPSPTATVPSETDASGLQRVR